MSTTQNQNRSLVKHQNDNISQGAVTFTWEANFDVQSSDTSAEEIKEVIPVPDSLKKEVKFIYVFTKREHLQCHRLLVSCLSDLCITI